MKYFFQENFDDSFAQLLETDLILLNKLVPAVIESNPAKVPLNTEVLETLSVAGERPIDDPVLLSTLAEQLKNATAATGQTLPLEDIAHNSVVFGSMRHILCGFSDEDLTAVFGNSANANNLLPIAGTLKSCPNPSALTIMANSVSTLNVF
jgi:hypothetical protein